jgi:hypothetical protein
MTMRASALFPVWVVLLLIPAHSPGLDFTSGLQSFKAEVRPGDVVTRVFTLHVVPGQPRAHFRARVEDWWSNEDGSQSFYRPPGTLSRSCGRWVSLNPVETSVEAGGVLEVRLTAAVPSTTAGGGYWCVLTVDELPDPLTPDPKVAVRFLSSVSTGIFLFVSPVIREVEVSQVRVLPQQIELQLRNTGNAPAGVEGRVEVFHAGGGDLVAAVALPRVTVLTEPVVSRWMKASFPALSLLPPGRYLMRIVLDLGLDHDLGFERELVLPDDFRPSS